MSNELFRVSDHPRLTKRGVRFVQQKVESFEEVSCRAGGVWVWEGGEGGRPSLSVAELRAPSSVFQNPFEAHPRLRTFVDPRRTRAFCLDIGGRHGGTGEPWWHEGLVYIKASESWLLLPSISCSPPPRSRHLGCLLPTSGLMLLQSHGPRLTHRRSNTTTSNHDRSSPHQPLAWPQELCSMTSLHPGS